MKDIKFRAFYPDGGMRNFEQIKDNLIGSLLYATGIKYMQFTGFTDDKGVDIYFGDIVYFCNFDEGYKGEAVVTENITGGMGLLFDYKNHKDRCFAVLEGGQIEEYWDDEDIFYIKVVGNIYENKNLLKGENK